jgi:hypothetical protein
MKLQRFLLALSLKLCPVGVLIETLYELVFLLWIPNQYPHQCKGREGLHCVRLLSGPCVGNLQGQLNRAPT